MMTSIEVRKSTTLNDNTKDYISAIAKAHAERYFAYQGYTRLPAALEHVFYQSSVYMRVFRHAWNSEMYRLRMQHGRQFRPYQPSHRDSQEEG